MSVILRRGRPADWAEILAVSDRSFGVDRGFFLRDYPHTYPGPDTAKNFVLCIDAGRIIGIINQTPVTLRLGNARVRAVGIGGVGTLPEARGRGAMSAMLAASADWQRRAGVALGFLWGDRVRYGRHGYELAGERCTVTLRADRLTTGPAIAGRRLTRKDAGALARIARARPVGALPTVAAQGQLLRRPQWTVHGVDDGGLRAYIVASKPHPRVIGDFGGPAETVARLLRGHVRRRGAAGVELSGTTADPEFRKLLERADYWSTQPAAQVRIMNFGALLTAAAPELAVGVGRFAGRAGLCLEHVDEGSRLVVRRDRGGRASVVPATAKRRPDLALDGRSWVRVFFPPPGGPLVDADPGLLAALRLPLAISVWEQV